RVARRRTPRAQALTDGRSTRGETAVKAYHARYYMPPLVARSVAARGASRHDGYDAFARRSNRFGETTAVAIVAEYAAPPDQPRPLHRRLRVGRNRMAARPTSSTRTLQPGPRYSGLHAPPVGHPAYLARLHAHRARRPAPRSPCHV